MNQPTKETTITGYENLNLQARRTIEDFAVWLEERTDGAIRIPEELITEWAPIYKEPIFKNDIALRFDGETFDQSRDGARLTSLLKTVYNLMLDGRWRTLKQIHSEIKRGTEASISARLRDLRKDRFGGFNV